MDHCNVLYSIYRISNVLYSIYVIMKEVHTILYSMSLLSTDVSTAQYVITVGTLQYIFPFTDVIFLLYIIS